MLADVLGWLLIAVVVLFALAVIGVTIAAVAIGATDAAKHLSQKYKDYRKENPR